ncbi:MAG: hypothetical protein JKY96_02220 [Phycisphaerales bacterium]|nr:hypothetical protein [Phycisphaerales bacterium]
MNTNGRKRGRPQGASRLNDRDRLTLGLTARFLANGETNIPTVAFRMAGADDDSHIRRLRRKWKIDSAKYLECARKEIQDENTPVRMPSRFYASNAIERVLAQQNAFDRIVNPPHLQAVRRLMAPFDQFRNSPTMQLMKVVQDHQRMFNAISRPMLAAERLARDWNRLG